MKVADYIKDVLVPANVAVAAIQRAGLPIDRDLLDRTQAEWTAEIERLAGVLRLDWQWYRAQAAEAHPEPKAWAGLKADGSPKGKGKK